MNIQAVDHTIRRWVRCWALVMLWGALSAPAGAAALEGPDISSSLSAIDNIDFCGEGVPVSRPGIRERLEKEVLLSAWDRAQAILWLKRSTRYFPYIEAVLRRKALPDDLKFIAVVESALRPHAGSRKGAVGFWQFMPQTARRYGLRVDERIDERRNVFISTPAAARYLEQLHQEMGSWTLAAAGYNMGEEGLHAERMVQGSDNFYELYLPLETQRFIFRILAAKLIFSNPQQFGFDLKPGAYYPEIPSDRIHIDCFQETPLRLIAEAADTRFKVIKDLNPEIRGHHLPAGSHQCRIPEGAAQGFEQRYQNLLTAYKTQQARQVYVVQSGDNLSFIADKFNVPLAALIIWNRIDLNEPIHPGDRLWIYPLGETGQKP